MPGHGPFDNIDVSGMSAHDQREANWMTDLYKEMYGPPENSPAGMPGGLAGAFYAKAWAGSPDSADQTDSSSTTAPADSSAPDPTDNFMDALLRDILKRQDV